MAKVGQRNANGIVNLGGRCECGIEVLPVQLPHQFEGDFAWNFPVEFSAGEFTARFAANMNREWRRRGVEELLGMVVGKNNPEIGVERPQPTPDIGRDFAHMRDHGLVLSLRHGEELRRMRQHGATDHCGHHGLSPLPEKYRAWQATTRRPLPPPRSARASHAATKPVRSAARYVGTKQGLVERKVEIEELFRASTLDIAKI